MKIILWDIDGTLLSTARAGLHAFQEAIEQFSGFKGKLKGITAAGMTDRHIASEIILKTTGSAGSPDEVTDLIKLYEKLLPAHLAVQKGFTIPPVNDILSYLDERSDYLSLLLTGNTVSGAKAKLNHFQLDHFFDFSISAFGDKYHKRSEVALQAMDSIKSRYPDIKPNQLFVIGDTPNDIICGKEIGAWTIAVATGFFTPDELRPYSPWWLVETLPTPELFIEKLNSVEQIKL